MAVTRRLDHPIARCGAIAGWVVLNVDCTTLAATNLCIAEAAAISYAKINGAANATTSGIYLAAQSLDLTDASPLDEIVWYLHVTDLTNIAYSFIRLGDDQGTNYVEYRFDDSDLRANQFTCCHVPLYQYVASAGTFCNFDNVVCITVGVEFDNQANALADITVDQICIRPTSQQDADVPGTILAADVAVANATPPTHGDGDAVPLSVEADGDLRTTVTDAQGVHDAAVPSDVLMQGQYAETGVPVAVADGDVVRPWHDEYGRQHILGYDPASGTMGVTDAAPAVQAKLGPLAFAQLTAAGSTAATNIRPYRSIVWQILVAAIQTSVTVRVEGSHDNTNWFNLDDAGADTTYTANGTYQLSKYGVSVEYTRFTFVSEVGGAAVTLDVDLIAGA